MGATQPERSALLLIGFNRPDLFARVAASAGSAGNRPVFVSIDGPREGRAGESALCAEVREVAESIEWATELRIRAHDHNLGCREAVTSAISWALSEAGEAIILEDDCLPDESFLSFCDELLERYREDPMVMEISGSNWGIGADRFGGNSYGFSSYANVWGWATWKRAWDRYVPDLAESWPAVRGSGAGRQFALSRRARKTFERTWNRLCDTDSEWYRTYGGDWSLNWQYSVLLAGGLSAVPAHNLVKNIGFRADATHIAEGDRIYDAMPLETMPQPLVHPAVVERTGPVEAVFDRIRWQKHGWPAQLFRRIVRNPALNRAIRIGARRVLSRPT